MNNFPICDMGGMIYFLLAIAIYISAIAFSVIILLEAIILWRLRWGSFTRSFFTSAGINLLSGIAGYLLIRAMGEEAVLDALQHRFWTLMIVTCLITICIEGILLILMKRSDWKLGLRAAITINVVSYIWNVVILQFIITHLGIQ